MTASAGDHLKLYGVIFKKSSSEFNPPEENRRSLAESLICVSHERIPTLDGWRAVAILAVFFAHLRWPVSLQRDYTELGNWGVELFFALSGFLITSRLLEEFDQLGCVRWTDFYIRRAFRILPPAFGLLAVLATLGLVLHLIPVTASQILAGALFYRNYWTEPGWYTAHFWSLAVEEQFYLLWPAVLSIVGLARGARAAVTLALAAGVWRALDMHFGWVSHYQPLLADDPHRTDYCIGQLFWGCGLAYLWRSRRIRRNIAGLVRSYWVAPLVAAQIVLLTLRPPGYRAAVEPLMAVLPLITAADTRGGMSRLLETAPLKWIGHLSYSLYLWQQLFLQSAIPVRALGAVAGAVVDFVLPFFPATVSYYLLERPFIAIGRRLEHRLQTRGRIPSLAEANP